MKTRHLILLAAAGIFALSSCFKTDGEEYIYTNLYGFGNVSISTNTLKVEPDGVEFILAEDKTDGKWNSLDRIYFCCDVLRATDDGRYDIRLKSYEPVVCKAALFKSRTSESVYGNDAVSFFQDWGLDWRVRSFNMACQLTSLTKSSTAHSVDFVFDDTRSHRDTLFFELHHQGLGESYENTDHQATEFQLETRYMTFDFSECIPADAGSNIVFSIEWDWFKSNELNGLTRELKHYQECAVIRLK
jgi:hypothetical protein